MNKPNSNDFWRNDLFSHHAYAEALEAYIEHQKAIIAFQRAELKKDGKELIFFTEKGEALIQIKDEQAE